jgi:hypothetical protein
MVTTAHATMPFYRIKNRFPMHNLIPGNSLGAASRNFGIQQAK